MAETASQTDPNVTGYNYLQLFPGSLGLPSLDPHSLSVLAYTKFTKAGLKIEQSLSRSKYIKPCLDLTETPALHRYEKNSSYTVEEILDVMRAMNFNADYELSKKELADSVAFITLMDKKLKPAVLHALWLEGENYEHVTRDALTSVTRFPSSLVAASRTKNYMYSMVYDSYNTQYVEIEDINKMIYKEALNCIVALSDKLGTKPFLFGNNPTSADAVMFGYLTLIFKLRLPKNRLIGHLESFQNLTNTLNLIIQRYFPKTAQELNEDRLRAEAKARAESEEFPHAVRDVFIAVVFGLSAIVTYILLKQNIVIEITPASDEQD